MRWSARRHLGGIFSVNKEQVKMRKCWQLLCRGYNLFLQLRLNNPIRTTDCNPRRKKVARRCTAATQYTFNMATEWRNCHHIASTGTHWRTLWQHTHTHTRTHARKNDAVVSILVFLQLLLVACVTWPIRPCRQNLRAVCSNCDVLKSNHRQNISSLNAVIFNHGSACQNIRFFCQNSVKQALYIRHVDRQIVGASQLNFRGGKFN